MNLDFAESIQFEDYRAKPSIEGVWRKALRKFRSLEGSFMEWLRLEDGHWEGFEPRQISVSWAEPERINAFHIPPKTPQDELWCVLQGGLLVWLVDLRQDSPTLGLRQSVFLSGEEPSILFIPTGVSHGYRAGLRGATLLYATSSQFHWEDPNEGRLPYDHFGAELWEDNRG